MRVALIVEKILVALREKRVPREIQLLVQRLYKESYREGYVDGKIDCEENIEAEHDNDFR